MECCVFVQPRPQSMAQQTKNSCACSLALLVSRSAVAITAGQTSRLKRVAVSGIAPDALLTLCQAGDYLTARSRPWIISKFDAALVDSELLHNAV